MLGPPSSDPALDAVGSPADLGGGQGTVAQPADAGFGGAGTLHGASCRRPSLPGGESDRIWSRRSCQGRALCEKAFKGDAQERLGAPCVGPGRAEGFAGGEETVALGAG